MQKSASCNPGSAGSFPAKKAEKIPSLEGWHSRGYLPHYDAGYGYQMLTYRLADSLPWLTLQTIKNEKNSEQQKRINIELELDKSYGSCILVKPEVAQIVINNWYWHHKKQYELIAYVVMPNHVHLLIRMFEGYSLSRLVHGWKSYTAKEIKKYLLKAGGPPALPGKSIWQQDYWGRYIRDEEHYCRAIEYIHYNPVKAGFCEQPHHWLWSSVR